MQRAYMRKKRALDAKDRKKALDARSRRREIRKTPKQKSSQQSRRITAKKAGAYHILKCDDKSDDWHYNYEQDTLGLIGEDTAKENTPNAAEQKTALEADAASRNIGECGICYDVKDVMPLMKT